MRIKEGVICETKKPNMQLSHQIYQPSYNSKQIPSWWPFTKSNPLPSAISSTCRPFIVLYKIPITGVFILSLLLNHPVPKTNLTTAFSFLYFPSFLFLSFLLSISCSAVNVRGQPAHRPVGPGLEIFVLITLPLEINYALLVRSARTGHACNFRDMWK